jgi:hypothetical protein
MFKLAIKESLDRKFKRLRRKDKELFPNNGGGP